MSQYALTAVAAMLLLRSCAAGVTEPESRVVDLQSLVEALRQGGATAALAETVEQPFFGVGGRIVNVNGEAVQAFEYPSESTAQTDAAKVSPDGSTIGTTSVQWMAPPHFFRKGRVIALYVGASRSVIDALTGVLGPQFAGR